MSLNDQLLVDTAFTTASSGMADLKTRTETLKETLKQMYIDLTTALDTPTGKQLNQIAEDALLLPIEDLLSVIQYTSSLLDEIKAAGYYQDTFDEYEVVNQKISF